jgi:quinolinate synthase
MKRITLENIHDSLRDLRHPVEVPAAIAARARVAIERMLALPRSDRPPDFATGRAPADVLVVPRA